MKVEFEGIKGNKELEEGMVLVSNYDDIHLIVETGDYFYVFDLDGNILKRFSDREDFENEYPTKKIYYEDEIKIILGKSN